MEVWKNIEGFEDFYQVSNLGRVKSLSRRVASKNGSYRIIRERILKTSTNGVGYPVVSLNKPNFSKKYLVHRLVAMAFIPNPCGYRVVNHKDENRRNCKCENLEWCTHKYNTNYGSCPDKISKHSKEHPRPRDPITGRFGFKR